MLALLKDGMYQNTNPDLSSEFKTMIRELNTIGLRVDRLHISHGKYVFYVTPCYDGKDTIEIEEYKNPKKELEMALMKIGEIETTLDESMDAKSRILADFHQRHDPNYSHRFDTVRKYLGKPRKMPDDFLETYEDIFDLALSSDVSPEKLKEIIGSYERKPKDYVMVLPRVGSWREVNSEEIKAVPRSEYVNKEPIKPISHVLTSQHRERLVRERLTREVAYDEQVLQGKLERNRIFDNLIVDLAFEAAFPDGLNVPEIQEGLNGIDLNGNAE
jgi:hypothetical protein